MASLLDADIVRGGRLDLIVGGMAAGKSTEMHRRIRRYVIAGRETVIIKHKRDGRSPHFETTTTHDSSFIQALVFPDLETAEEHFKVIAADVIGIDEGQFFDDIERCLGWVSRGKIVIIAALDGDSNGDPFGYINRLYQHADSIEKLRAICVKCREEALYSYRVDGSDSEVIKIGGLDTYQPLCRFCYEEAMSNRRH